METRQTVLTADIDLIYHRITKFQAVLLKKFNIFHKIPIPEPKNSLHYAACDLQIGFAYGIV